MRNDNDNLLYNDWQNDSRVLINTMPRYHTSSDAIYCIVFKHLKRACNTLVKNCTGLPVFFSTLSFECQAEIVSHRNFGFEDKTLAGRQSVRQAGRQAGRQSEAKLNPISISYLKVHVLACQLWCQLSFISISGN